MTAGLNSRALLCFMKDKFFAMIAAHLAVILFLGLALPLIAAEAASSIDVSNFSSVSPSGNLPGQWDLQTFPSIDAHTEYSIVTDKRYGLVIRAEAAGSAAGLVRKISVDPQEYPILAWSWKVSKTLDGSSLANRQGDDFPARILVSFGSDLFGTTAGRTLCYVWATVEPVETMMKSPYHKGVVTIVASSGDSTVGRWQEVRRNIAEDYLKAYGEMPESLRAIALLSDSDNTADHVVAWYGPISLIK